MLRVQTTKSHENIDRRAQEKVQIQEKKFDGYLGGLIL